MNLDPDGPLSRIPNESIKAHNGAARKRQLLHVGSQRQAKKVIGTLSRGAEIYMVVSGQFNAINVIEAVMDQMTEPVKLDISSWTIARFDIDRIATYIKTGKISRFRFVTDRSFGTRHPELLAHVVNTIDIDAVRILRCHCKFCTFESGDWRIALRTSANMNSNRRIENYEISDDAALWQYMTDFVDEVFTHPAGLPIGRREMKDLKTVGYLKNSGGNDSPDDDFDFELPNFDFVD